MRTILLFFLFNICVSLSYSQSNQIIGCGYDIYVRNLIEKYPQLESAIQAPYKRETNDLKLRGNETYSIQVVVHIVYQNEKQNIPDEQVYEVIDKVNKDYSRTNEDAGNVRQVFAERVASPNIQFEVYAIEHVKTDTIFQFGLFTGLPDYIKRSQYGGSDAYNTAEYLNIWVGNIEGGLLGYAYPPADLFNWPENASAPVPELDGVVIDYEAFSVYDTFKIYRATTQDTLVIPIRGRTVTHEIGHYLGLRHIWGDGLSILGIPACEEDDGMEDTPNSGFNAGFTCDTTLNTCIADTLDEKDMIENFMDYAAETCMNSFTEDQVLHMRSVLEHERYSLIDSSTSTSSKSPGIKPRFSIYPNPGNTYVNLVFTKALNKDLMVEVYDLQGEKVFLKKIVNAPRIIGVDISTFQSGIYFLKIQSAGIIHTQKLIVR